MAVKIRLKRMGAKKKPFYRIVVADSRKTRDGQVIEELGYYDPLKEPAEIKIDGGKAQKWISNGAQPTDIVKALLKKSGALEAAAINAGDEAAEEPEIEVKPDEPDTGESGSIPEGAE